MSILRFDELMLRPAVGVALLALTAGCSVGSPPVLPENPSVASTSPAATATPTISSAGPPPRRSATPTPTDPRPPTMDADAALRDVRRLAGDIGPREATSDNFARAADVVQARFDRLGYEVRRTTVRVPAGTSWGTPVRRVRQRMSSPSRRVSIGASLTLWLAPTLTPCPRRQAPRTTRRASPSCCSWPGWRCDHGTANGARLVLQTSATIRLALPPVTSRGVNSSSIT
jgi:hypothetical protein